MSKKSDKTMYDFDSITFKDENQKAIYMFLESINIRVQMAQKILIGELDASKQLATTPDMVIVDTATDFAHMVSLISKKNGGDITGFSLTAEFNNEAPYQKVHFQLHREGQETNPQINVKPGDCDDR